MLDPSLVHSLDTTLTVHSDWHISKKKILILFFSRFYHAHQLTSVVRNSHRWRWNHHRNNQKFVMTQPISSHANFYSPANWEKSAFDKAELGFLSFRDLTTNFLNLFYFWSERAKGPRHWAKTGRKVKIRANQRKKWITEKKWLDLGKLILRRSHLIGKSFSLTSRLNPEVHK